MNNWSRIRRVLAMIAVGLQMCALAGMPAVAQDPPAVISDEDLAASNQRWSSLLQAISCTEEDVQCGDVVDGAKNAIIIGDSIAVDANTILRTGFPDVNFILLTKSACAPFAVPGQAEVCEAWNAQRAAHLEALSSVKDVVLAVDIVEERVGAISDYIATLAGMGHRVIVLGEIQRYRREVPEIYRRLASADNPRPEMSDYTEVDMFSFDEALKQATLAVGGVYIERSEFFCPEGKCRDYTVDMRDLNVRDRSHLSYFGAVDFGHFVAETHPGLF